MKKIYINENSISNILTKRLLPQFLFKMVRNHTTSLGDNEAFPTSDDYPFDYTLLKERYNEVCEEIEGIGMASLDEDSLVSELSSLVKECKELEKPVRDSLEKLCENALNKLFAIPEEAINFKFKLVDKIKFKNSIRMKPESNNETQYTFKDVAEIDLSSKAIKKRRFIDALIQGASYTYSRVEGLYLDEIDKINPELPRMYRKIRIINDYLLFTKKEEMSDDKPMQGSYVETHLGIGNSRTTISVQGIIFPLLLQESIRGMFELFSSHGLPQDRKKAEYIVKKADFVLAEPWDLRLGVGLWKMIFGSVEDTNMIPYMFTAFVKMPTDEFNLSAREILSSTEKGQSIIDELIKNAEYDNGYQQFTNRINAKNLDKALIQDSYFTGAETNGYEIDTENEEGDVIEEEGEDPNNIESILSTATVDNIDFIEGEEDGYGEKVYLSVEGVEIPQELVNLDFRIVNKRFPTGKKQLLNIDIILDPKLRGMGLGTKIYAKAVYEFGAICSRFSTRHNDDGIRGIFSKLNSFGDIYTFEDSYQNLEGETINDYYAILKSELNKYIPIQENRYAKKEVQLITENWAKDKRRIISRTVDILKNNSVGTTIYDAYKLEHEIEQSYFHGSMAGDGKIRKYEPMIANILTREFGYPRNPGNTKEADFLKNVLIYMWNFQIRKGIKPSAVCEYGNNVVMDDFETLVSKYKPLLDELESKGEDIEFLGESDYEIVPIEDFKTAKKYGDYSNPNGKLCYTQGKGTWDSYTDNGANHVFLCLNEKTWEKWKIGERPADNENTPYDEYGLSMIWVFIDEGGDIAYSNTRWNHNMESRIPNGGYGGKNVDHSFDGKSLEKVLNMPFEKAFGVKLGQGFNHTKYTIEKLEKINNGLSSISDEFSAGKCSMWKTNFNGIIGIRVGNKVNFIKMDENDNMILLSPDIWFDYASVISEDEKICPRVLSVVYANSKCNLIDIDGNMMLPNSMWCDKIQDTFITTGSKKFKVYALQLNKLFNCLGPDGNLLFNDWVVTVGSKIDCLTIMKNDGSLEIFDEETRTFLPLNEIIENHTMRGEELPPNVAKNVEIDNYGVIRFYKYENLIGDNGEILNEGWFKDITNVNENVSIVTSTRGLQNLIDNNTGKIIYRKPMNEWLIDITPISSDGTYFSVERDNKVNIMDSKGNLFFQSENLDNWADSIDALDIMQNRKVLRITCNGKNNVLTEDMKLLWDAPKEKWFDKIYLTDDEKYFKVSVNNKYNLLTLNGNLALDEFVDYIGDDGYYVYLIRVDNRSNFIRQEDLSLVYNAPLEEWFDEASSFRYNNKVTAVSKNGRSNFLSLDGSLLLNEWILTDITTYNNGEYSEVTAENGLKNIVDRVNGTLVSNQWFQMIRNLDNTPYLKCYVDASEPTNIYFDTINKEIKVINGRAAMHDFEANPIGDSSIEEYIREHFGEDCKVKTLIEGKLYVITEYLFNNAQRAANLLSLDGGKPRFLLPKWVERIGKPVGNVVSVKIDDSSLNKNVFNLNTCSYVFDKPVDMAEVERDDKLIWVYNGELQNIVEQNGNVVFDNWPTSIRLTSFDGIYKVKYDDKYNMYDLNHHRFVANQNFDFIDFFKSSDNKEINNGYYLVGVNNPDDKLGLNNGHYKYNIIDKNGELLLKDWYTIIALDSNNNYVLYKFSNSANICLNRFDVSTYELLSDYLITFSKKNNIGVATIIKNRKYNLVDGKLDIILPQWADYVKIDESRGYVVVKYGNEVYNYIAENGKLTPIEAEGNVVIPQDFTECNRNQIDLIDHILRYELIGFREGSSEHTTSYRQKVTVILKDGYNTAKNRIYSQRGDESCKWTMYEAYESLCKELGVKPAYME